MPGAGLVIELGDLPQSAIGHRRRERRDDEAAAEPPGKFDRRLREGGDIGRQRALHRFGGDRDIVEPVMPAVMGDRPVGRPETADHLHPFFEYFLIVLERDVQRQILAPVVTAAGGEIDAAAGEQVQRRPLLGDPDRMMQRQDRDGGRKADAFRPSRDIGEHQIGAGKHAQCAEMMLADPRGVKADLIGINRLVEYICNKGVGRSFIVLVMIVAQREIAEFHWFLCLVACSLGPVSQPLRHNSLVARRAPSANAANLAQTTVG